jgi:NAD(P)-dependent dehydrogenase (short-subunit alcohol dehydrogenase family)
LAAARRFIEEGARVVVAGRTPDVGLSEPELRSLGLCGQLTIELALGQSEVTRLFDMALPALGDRLDILLHVAGISGRKHGDGALHECSDEGWDSVIRINAFGVFLTNRAAVRTMRDQAVDASGLRGTIVNVGSVLDRSPSPEHFGTLAYAASKGAVRALTLASAARYAPERIRFNLLAPGLVDTPMAARATADPQILAYLRTKQPMALGPIFAGDIADASLYLCEPASRFVTGVELVVDGGWCVSEGVVAGDSQSFPPLGTAAAPFPPLAKGGSGGMATSSADAKRESGGLAGPP